MSTPPDTPDTRRRDTLAGLVVTTGGAVLLLLALRIAEPARESPGLGPQVLPLVVSGGLLLCGLLLVISTARGSDHTSGIGDDLLGVEDGDEVEEVLDWDEPPVPWSGLAIVVALLVLYALLYIPVGFIVSTVLFLAALTTWVDPRRWRRNLLFALVLPVTIYFLFTELLAVQLPSGILPF